MSKPHYRTYCRHCECTVRTDDESTFMRPFFLPQRCPGCHRPHSRFAYDWEKTNLYKVEYGYWQFVPADPQPRKVWWRPSTWKPAGKHIWTLREEAA